MPAPAPAAARRVPDCRVETHSAVVTFSGDLALKRKKPVSLGFVDFTDREVRRRTLQRELELNRRIAPDVYLDVVDDDAGEPVLVMRRLPADRSLARLLETAPDDELRALVRAVARTAAAFHARSPTSRAVAATGSPAFVAGLWEEGLAQQGRFTGVLLDRAVHRSTRELALQYLAGRSALLEERVRAGRVRDGHGDLLAADVYCLPDGPRVLDCIEFDDRLRFGDVLLDAAFLAMDLERLGRADLGAQFLRDWAEFGGESHPPSLAEHYVAYRAHVRSKVACLRWEQGDVAAADEARRLAGMCLEHLERAQVRLVLVGGLPGTGKSTLAAGLADADGWLLLRSDAVRKAAPDVAGDTAAPFGEGLYAPDRRDAVYVELLARAGTALARGESVVLDATWSDARWRARAAEVAEATRSELVELRCTVAPEVAAARLATRTGDLSDADAAVAARLAEQADPWPDAVQLDTGAARAEVLRAARRAVGPQPGGQPTGETTRSGRL